MNRSLLSACVSDYHRKVIISVNIGNELGTVGGVCVEARRGAARHGGQTLLGMLRLMSNVRSLCHSV